MAVILQRATLSLSKQHQVMQGMWTKLSRRGLNGVPELTRIRSIGEKAITDYAEKNDFDIIIRADGTTLYAKKYKIIIIKKISIDWDN